MMMSHNLLFKLLVSFAFATLVRSAAINGVAGGSQKRATVCNGSAALCERLYSNVTYAGAHNSYAIEPPSRSILAANQNVSITQQLDAGIRMLQSQAHRSSNTSATGAGIDLCHTNCNLFQGGALEYYLGQVKAWTDANPNEVVTLLIVNSDGLPAAQFAQAFQSTGLADKMFSPSQASFTRSQWPTLGALIDSGKPVVGFITAGADASSAPYLMDEFVNIWETPFGQTTVPFNCSVDRIGQSISDSSSLMYLSNQFRDVSLFGTDSGITMPDKDNIGESNSLQTTLQTSNQCASMHNNVYPTFILTDFSTTPSYQLMQAVAQMNGVSYTAPSGSTNSNGQPSSSSPGNSSGSLATYKSSSAQWSSALLALSFAVLACIL